MSVALMYGSLTGEVLINTKDFGVPGYPMFKQMIQISRTIDLGFVLGFLAVWQPALYTTVLG